MQVSLPEAFIGLPAEKRKGIVDAALKCFGANGYKKASASDIARAAGISKAMVFHYFGTKRALDGIDTSKFKEGVEIGTVTKTLTWLIEGFVGKLSGESFEAMLKDLDASLDLLKRSFYQERYL